MKKILIINLIVIIFMLVFLEFISFIYVQKFNERVVTPYNKYAKLNKKPLLTSKYGKINVFNQDEYTDYREVSEGSKNKPSILFFGCSYIRGANLDNIETIPYLIAKKTGYTTINRGIDGGGVFNMLHDLNDENFYKYISKYPKPKYIFYMWINDQFYRIYNPYMGTVTETNKPSYCVRVLFKEKNGKYIEDKPNFIKKILYHLYITKAFYYLFSQTMSKDTPQEKMLKYLKESAKIIKEKFPTSKFIIIQYKDGSHKVLPNELKEALNKNGIQVIDAEELAGHELESEKWRGIDKEHPNAKAFNDVSDGLSKKINLKQL